MPASLQPAEEALVDNVSLDSLDSLKADLMRAGCSM